MTDRCDALIEIITQAAGLLSAESGHEAHVSAKAVNDFVTDSDRKVEKFIRSGILSRFPDDGFLGEESGRESSRDGFVWIVDPVDGTVNFMNRFPQYSISIALEKDGQLLAGAVCNPYFNELFWAKKGEGAYLNGKRIHAQSALPLSQTLALVVPPHRKRTYFDAFWEKEKYIYSLVSDTRSIGSAAMSLCHVAAGRCSLYYEWFLHIYDIAAGLIICSEAGCRYTLSENEDGISVLCFSKAYDGEIDEGKLI